VALDELLGAEPQEETNTAVNTIDAILMPGRLGPIPPDRQPTELTHLVRRIGESRGESKLTRVLECWPRREARMVRHFARRNGGFVSKRAVVMSAAGVALARSEGR
jgi:hypothetical protein